MKKGAYLRLFYDVKSNHFKKALQPLKFGTVEGFTLRSGQLFCALTFCLTPPIKATPDSPFPTPHSTAIAVRVPLQEPPPKCVKLSMHVRPVVSQC